MRSLLTLTAAGALALAAAGCGSDSSSSSDTQGATAPAATTTAAAPTTTAAAAPGALTIKMTEFAFTPKDVTAKAGKVTITAPNNGKVVHELVVLRTNADPAHLPMDGDEVDETKAVGEIPDVAAGATKSATLDLKPGKYAMICNLPGHYKSGMYGSITVK